MFAAAAVAAAAALTAISTTQSSGPTTAAGGVTTNAVAGGSHGAKQQQTGVKTGGKPAATTTNNRLQQPAIVVGGGGQLHPPQYTRWNTSEPAPLSPQSPSKLSHFHSTSSARSLDGGGGGGPNRPYISWKQYAMQRRNSMQRRKVEISRRLEQASTANQKKTYNIQQFQANKQKSTDLNGSLTSHRSFASDLTGAGAGAAGLNMFKRQNTTATTDSPDTRFLVPLLHYLFSLLHLKSIDFLLCFIAPMMHGCGK